MIQETFQLLYPLVNVFLKLFKLGCLIFCALYVSGYIIYILPVAIGKKELRIRLEKRKKEDYNSCCSSSLCSSY